MSDRGEALGSRDSGKEIAKWRCGGPHAGECKDDIKGRRGREHPRKFTEQRAEGAVESTGAIN